jgi:hypothetical protein
MCTQFALEVGVVILKSEEYKHSLTFAKFQAIIQA